MLRPPLSILLAGVLFTAGLGVLVVLTGLDLWRSYADAESAVMRKSRVLGIALSAGLESAFRRGTFDEARSVFQSASSVRDLELAILADDQGRIVFSNQFRLRGLQIANVLSSEDLAAVNSTSPGRGISVSVTPDGSTVLGIVRLALQADGSAMVSSRTGTLFLKHRLLPEKQAALSRAITFALITALVLLALSAVAWCVFHRFVVHRVKSLVDFADRFRAGSAPEPVDTRGNDELAAIGSAMSAMARRVHESTSALRQSSEFLDAALDAVPASIAIVDGAGRIVQVNRAWRDFADANGLATPGYGVGASYLDACIGAGEDRSSQGAAAAAALRNVLHGEIASASLEYDCHSPTEKRWFHMWISRFEAQDRPQALVAHVNITESKHAARTIAHGERRYRALYDDNPAMFFTVSRDATLLSVNQFGAEQLGYAVDDLLGTDAQGLYEPADRDEVREHLERCFANAGQIHRWEATKLRRDGTTLRVRETGRVFMETYGQPAVLVVCEDISEADALSRELRHQASHDALTGLINRREFEKRLAHLIRAAQSDASEHVLAYIDLDQFKVINDTSGHVAGDELLRQIALLIRGQLRRQDTLARLGGDEFGVLMEHCSLEKGSEIAQQLCASARELRFAWEGRPFTVGASIGIVRIDSDSVDVNELLRTADTACYAAKDGGRNRVHVYTPGDEEVLRREGELRWLPMVQQAMDENRIELFYQLIVPCLNAPYAAGAAGDGGLHYEILIRLRHPDGSLVSPGAFLPAVERFGLAPMLDGWVLEHVLCWLAGHPAHLEELTLCSINLSGQTVSEPEFVDHVHQAMTRHGIPASKICFELTETAAASDLTHAMTCIDGLRALGCQVALDDFGSGMSSFGYLKHLAVDFLKIDGVFVKDIVSDPLDAAMVRSINQVGHVLGKRTVAEFVESDEILDVLTGIGVDYAQGYGIHRPSPLAALLEPVTSEAGEHDRGTTT